MMKNRMTIRSSTMVTLRWRGRARGEFLMIKKDDHHVYNARKTLDLQHTST